MKTFIKIGALTVPAEDWVAPMDRTFREAWTISDPTSGAIEIDMIKAKAIYKDKVREARAPLFAALDAAFMQAMETGADTTDIVARKQELRDATSDPRIAAAKTPEELKIIKPAGLEV